MDRALSGAITPGQSGPGSNGYEGVLCIPQSPSITGTSPSDCLVSYLGHSLGGGLTPLQRCSQCILQLSQLGNYIYYIYIYIYIYICVCVCVVCVFIYIYIYIYIYKLGHWLNGPGDWGSIPWSSHTKDSKKWYLIPHCLTLSIIRSGSRVK